MAGVKAQACGGAEAAEGFLVACDLAALEYAFPVGESEIAVVSLDISPSLVKFVGQVCSDSS